MKEEKALNKKIYSNLFRFFFVPFRYYAPGMKYRRSCDSTGDGERFKRVVHSSSLHPLRIRARVMDTTRWREGRKQRTQRVKMSSSAVVARRRLVRVAVKFLCFRLEKPVNGSSRGDKY